MNRLKIPLLSWGFSSSKQQVIPFKKKRYDLWDSASHLSVAFLCMVFWGWRSSTVLSVLANNVLVKNEQLQPRN